MRKRVVIDGTPDEVKVSCPVWRGGKSGDNLKGLPITIGHHLRRLRAEQPDGGDALQSPRQPDGFDRFCQQGKGQCKPELADGRARPARGLLRRKGGIADEHQGKSVFPAAAGHGIKAG